MNSSRIYEDGDGIQYRCIGFDSDKGFKMKIIDSPYSEIHEGITEWMDELPDKNINSSPVNTSNPITSTYE